MKTRKQVHRTGWIDNGWYVVGRYDKLKRNRAIRRMINKNTKAMKEIEEITTFDETSI